MAFWIESAGALFAFWSSWHSDSLMLSGMLRKGEQNVSKSRYARPLENSKLETSAMGLEASKLIVRGHTLLGQIRSIWKWSAAL